MSNHDLAKIFGEIADLLEIKGEDRFRVNSYRKASRTIGDLTEDVTDLAKRGQLQTIPGVGKGTAERISQYLKEGKIDVHQELLTSLPEGILALLNVPGLGPKKVAVLHHVLGVCTLDDLKHTIEQGKVQKLAGFGEKTATKILEGITFLEQSAGRTPLGVAQPIADNLRDQVARLPNVKRVTIAGSLRRGQETIGDLDLLCDAKDGKPVVEAFTKLPEVTGVRASGDTKGSVVVASPLGGEIQVDLRVVLTESFGAAHQYFTGSKEHNVRLREIAIKKGYRLNEYGLFKDEKAIAGRDEEGIYKKLGLPWIPPELREDRGEIECKEKLPDLISLADINGDLHVHTTYSDGRHTIVDMAEAAKAKGYNVLAITDHSKSSAIANGLSADRLLEQIEDIRVANKKVKGITILAGTECDILADGTLDFPDEVLAQLDWVVVSIHAGQQQDRQKVTHRSIAAMENPYVCALGHPSGRLIGVRDAMDLDWNTVIKAAAKTGTALEINAAWQRLDLKDVHVRQAMDAGCWLAIGTDAHHVNQLDQMALGVQTARRGWATKDRVLNAKTVADLRKWVTAKRK